MIVFLPFAFYTYKMYFTNMVIIMKRILQIITFAVCILNVASATIIHIPEDYPAIQQGIDAAVEGDTVLVYEGTYYENLNFNGNNIVVISTSSYYEENANLFLPIIDGGQNGSVVTFESGENSTAMLDGFWITNGQGGGQPSNSIWGGGVTIKNESSPTLTHLSIFDNESIGYWGRGSGIFIADNSNSIIKNVSIEQNNSVYLGGGIYCENSSPELININIRNNFAHEGAGLFFTQCEFEINQSSIKDNGVNDIDIPCLNGGGLSISSESNGTIKNTVIASNITQMSGGGILVKYSSNLILENVTIDDNEAQCGGGINLYDYSAVQISNSIIWSNSQEGIYSSPPGFEWGPTEVTISYTDIENGQDGVYAVGGSLNWLNGNIDTDPLFVDPDNGDFNLQEGSPCIDAGTPFFVWEGDTLVNMSPDEYLGSAPDMGAFEYGTVSISNQSPVTPHQFVLHQNYPNPFNPVTTIRFDIPVETTGSVVSGRRSGGTSLHIFDVKGRLVETLIDNVMESGSHSVIWNASDVASGVYIYRLVTGNNVITKKMVLLK